MLAQCDHTLESNVQGYTLSAYLIKCPELILF